MKCQTCGNEFEPHNHMTMDFPNWCRTCLSEQLDFNYKYWRENKDKKLVVTQHEGKTHFNWI
jgi:predicted Zn-ribbon and HTH transcriptional regulator